MLKIPGYSYLQELHVGLNARVWRGLDESNEKRPVIIKLPLTDQPSNRDITRIKHEYLILKQLKAIPDVIQLKEFVQNQLIPVLIFEDIGGTPLNEYMKNRSLSLEFFFKISVQLADILERLYQQGIIHKDIKPSNILINKNNLAITLIDFSSASSMEDLAQDEVNLELLTGTLAYMSPEQTGRMNRALDYRTDMYSLGIVFYELLAGHPPFTTKKITELAYCHLAVKPPLVNTENPSVPLMVARIIDKLLAKMPEDRYNHTLTLKLDLEHCEKDWRERGIIPEFKLAQDDIQDKLTFSPKLYGREEDIKHLLAFFANAIEVRTSLILIGGFSGIGKTSLVKEVQKPMTKEGGAFIQGKYDSLKRSPLSAIIEAFDRLIKQQLVLADEQLTKLKQALEQTLGLSAQVLIEVIPSLELILGKQKPVEALPPIEAQNRFNLVCMRFVQVFIKERPLILFLDDLQWADTASLNFIKNLLADPTMKNLLIIGAYRENEVDAYHPLLTMLEELKKEIVPIEKISLQPLELAQVIQFIADMLSLSRENAKPLAELVKIKTGGNPFFMHLFLKTLNQKKLLIFNYEQRRWQFNMEAIEQQNITDNVVELMSYQIKELAQDLQNCLKYLACIGFRFDLQTLKLISGGTYQQISHQLKLLIQANLIIPVGDAKKIIILIDGGQKIPKALLKEKIIFHFAHDRIQQASYFLFSKEERQSTHLKLARLLSQDGQLTQKSEELFEVANHFEKALELVEKTEEKRRVATYYLWAGLKARNATSYQVAADYFAKGLLLLDEDAWQETYQLIFSLNYNQLECLYFLGKFEQDTYVSRLLTQAKTKEDKAEIYLIKLAALTRKHEHQAALKIASEALQLFNYNLPLQVNRLQMIAQIISIRLRLSPKKLDSITSSMKPASEYSTLLIFKILHTILVSLYLSNPNLYVYVVCCLIQLSLAKGYAAETSNALSSYALILIGVLDKISLGLKFYQASKVIEKEKSTPMIVAQNQQTMAYGFSMWMKTLAENVLDFKEAFNLCLEAGALEYACYARLGDGTAYRAGKPLLELKKAYEESLAFFKWVKNDVYIRVFQIESHFLDFLMGKEKTAETFIKDLEMLLTTPDMFKPIWLIILCELCCLNGDYQTALIHGEEFMQLKFYLIGHIEAIFGTFFYGLALVNCYQQTHGTRRLTRRLEINKIFGQLKHWGKASPINFGFMYPFMLAEFKKYSSKNIGLILKLYDSAIQSAAKNSCINFVAFINECAGRYLIANDLPTSAKAYIQIAGYAYQRWNAFYKCKKLSEEFPEWLGSMQGKTGEADSLIAYSDTTSTTAFDFHTILEANQAISKEINLENLIRILLQISMEYTGAQRAFFFFEKEDVLVVIAAAVPNEPIRVWLEGKPLKEFDLPQTILAYLQRTNENILLNEAVNFEQFKEDPYLLNHNSKSILCFPILQNKQAIGYIYLENQLTSSMFLPKHLELLNLLSGQAAISLENARLYAATGQFVPVEFLQQLGRSNLVKVRLGDQVEREMAVLFCDIRDFTTLSEGLLPAQLFEFVNLLLGKMAPIIIQKQGFIDKFIGDAIMALFEKSDDAVYAAIAMIEELEDFNNIAEQKGYPRIRIGVGINTGMLMLGILGAHQRMEGTVLGDAVNVASRIEGLNKQFHSEILISDATKNLLPKDIFELEKMGEAAVKGKTGLITIWRVHGFLRDSSHRHDCCEN